MRLALRVAGVVLVILGGVWLVQGAGVLKGSFMTGQPFWAWMGALAALLGVAALARGFGRQPGR
jgi:hypothetical protein